MTDREKLIELIGYAKSTHTVCSSDGVPLTSYDTYMVAEVDDVERLADHLLANGVIVLPCKVGDRVWFIENVFTLDEKARGKMVKRIGSRMIDSMSWNLLNNIWMVAGGPDEMRFHPYEFGKTVFLTREEAEAALKEGQG